MKSESLTDRLGGGLLQQITLRRSESQVLQSWATLQKYLICSHKQREITERFNLKSIVIGSNLRLSAKDYGRERGRKAVVEETKVVVGAGEWTWTRELKPHHKSLGCERSKAKGFFLSTVLYAGPRKRHSRAG